MISSWIKFNESTSDHRDNTDTERALVSKRNTNYKLIQRYFRIDKDDIRNILQDFLDDHGELTMECVYYSASIGFLIYFYKIAPIEYDDTMNMEVESSMNVDTYPIQDEVREEIDDRLSEWGLSIEVSYTQEQEYLIFNIHRI